MARYRTKDDTELAWNATRRTITREVDVKIAKWREALLNDLLAEAWEKHAALLERGEVRELEPEALEFVNRSLNRDVVIALPS